MPPVPEPDAARPGAGAPLLFLLADTGGGHRASAIAVGQALDLAYPGLFAPVYCDPLGGPEASPVLRWLTGRYGLLLRYAPWLWALLYHGTDSRPATWLLRASLLAPAYRPVAAAVERHRPALVVSYHPLLGGAAARAGTASRTVTVVTDLITAHRAWRDTAAERVVVPSAAVRARCLRDGLAAERCLDLGLPVGAGFAAGPLPPYRRAALRRRLGLDPERFLVVLTGGGEGTGGLARRAVALLRGYPDLGVVVICGRNRRLARRLARVAAGAGGRLTVRGYVDDMADWLRCADVLVAKAGPGTIAEATCCGVPLILTCQAPGQEKGNAAFVVRAGAGRRVRGVRHLVAEIGRLRADPADLARMRAASAGLARPRAAIDIATLIAELTGVTQLAEAADRAVSAVHQGYAEDGGTRHGPH